MYWYLLFVRLVKSASHGINVLR